jgi:hypothetical protein
VEPSETVDPGRVLLMQRELELLRAKLTLIKDHGLDYYRPHEKQHEFHSSAAKRRGFFAGNRTGKSECDAAETVAWFLGERTWYKYRFPIYGVRDGLRVVVSFHEGHENHPLVRQGIPQHATKQLVITTDWKKVDEVWTSALGDPPGKIWKFIPKSLKVETRRNHEGIIDRIYHEPTGAVIRFTNEQAFIKNPQSGESTDYDRIAIDEPIANEMWTAHARGLIDRDGQGDFTLTSLRERWIYDYFNPEEATDSRIDRFAVRATMHDNPFLSAAAKQRFIDELSPDELECRVNGLPLELSGLVYKEFQREKHVLKDLPVGWGSWTNPPSNHTIYVSIDVHSQTPQAALFVAVGPSGRPVIYDEIWRSCNADELAAEVLLRLDGRQIGFVKCDPRAWDEDPVYHCSMAQRFFANGLFVEKASKALTFGIQNMKSVLKDFRCHFTPAVRRTLWEITRWHYDKENKPIDKDDHLMECMYRIFINTLVHIDPAKSRPVEAFDLDMSSRILRDFDHDMKVFDRATLN